MRRWMFRFCLLTALCSLSVSGCFSEAKKPKKKEKEAAKSVSGELFEVASQRGLSKQQIVAALSTFVPSGGRDAYIGVMGAGTSGRAVIFGMPSMRILKYVGVFTPEPWQGFAYDDESKETLLKSAREEIEYLYGDSGLPALSESAGVYDGVAAFFADGANGRVAVLHFDDYETKQVVTNPIFKSSSTSVAVTSGTEYVLQSTAAPELPVGDWAAFNDPNFAKKLRGGITFWPFVRGGHHANRLSEDDAFTVELPPYVQEEMDAGKGVSEGLIFSLGRCLGEGVVPGVGGDCSESGAAGALHIIDLGKAKVLASKATQGEHARLLLAQSVSAGALYQLELSAAPTSIAISPDGATALVTHARGEHVSLIDLVALKAKGAQDARQDAFGVPTLRGDGLIKQIKVGGASADAAFANPSLAYVSVIDPGKLIRLELATASISAELSLGFAGGKLMLPHAETVKPTGEYAVVMNTQPKDRFASVGPVQALNPYLVDISQAQLQPLYDMAVPQATRIEAVAISADVLTSKVIMRYAQGTNTRSGALSEFRTAAGEERVERKGNRVHVFGTLIRSHITPEVVEVLEGDVVTFHLTNLEQAQDQTHGFTISTYNVHSSWEPGKVASVTFTADKAGVYPYYCTEFCSALHLEMMGYLLVRPKDYQGQDAQEREASAEELAKANLEYEAKLESIKQTQAVIDSVVKWLNDNNYKKDSRAVSLVDDAVNQLKAASDIQPRIDKAVEAKDWLQAKLWAEQYYQYQVKAADAGVRAKKILLEGGQ